MKRRDFLTYSAATAAFTIVPRHVLGGPGHIPPSEIIQVAGIGIGGVGHGQIQGVAAQVVTRIAYLCDVDDAYARKTYNKFPQAKVYRDYRELLRLESDKIDAVYCGTPDHTHAVICSAALKKGKHLCCVKPLTRTMDELRVLTEGAHKMGVATQVTASANTHVKAYKKPPDRLTPRSGTWGEWVEAMRGGEPAGCNFDWAEYITAAVLLGNIAIRTGKTLDWDIETRRFTNYKAANKYLKEPYRSGWNLTQI